MNFFKNWPYWLRGALIAVFVIILFLVISGVISKQCVAIGDPCYNKINPILKPISTAINSLDIFYFIIVPFSNATPGWEGLLHVLTIWFSYFLIGAIIGWIIGKIKNK